MVSQATRMFDERGFEATRVDDIADAADVAVGTLYNHFPTKSELLLAVLTQDVDEIVLRSQGIGLDDISDPNAAARAFVSLFLEVLERRARQLWRALYAQALLEPERLGARFLASCERFRGLLVALLGSEERGNLAYAAGFALLFVYVLDDRTSAEQTERAFAERVQIHRI